MKMFAKILWIVATILSLFHVYIYAQQQDSNGQQLVSQLCLGCICEISSECNITIGCDGSVCGPFAITHAYWADADKPTLNNESHTKRGAFQRCVNDPYCAANTVQNYMAKFGQDCTGNGIIDCDDYVRIHYLGAGCKGKMEKRDESIYQLCIQTYGR